jgi:hypothetical protein
VRAGNTIVNQENVPVLRLTVVDLLPTRTNP